jgi:hypothetical protein
LYSLSDSQNKRVEECIVDLNKASGLDLGIVFQKEILVGLQEKERARDHEGEGPTGRLCSNPQDPR